MSDIKPVSGVFSIGEVVDYVEVTIGPKFLELFSEQMYSSPNKTFEELVSNSWDAGAEVVYIGVPDDLSDESASIWVLDDGESMDLTGLHELWNVAISHKRIRQTNGRQQIGKFGVGKLSTFSLAHQLTYICRAADGIIRAITMDYRLISGNVEEASKLHIDPVKLDVRILDFDGLRDILGGFKDGKEILRLIEQGIPKPPNCGNWDDEFGGKTYGSIPKKETWTLALLTTLKPNGKEIQIGRTRWLLRTALPLGSSICIVLNGEPLTSSKTNVEVSEEWVLGKNLGISSIVLSDNESRAVSEFIDPYPHVHIEGIEGEITGRIRLYKDNISGGKSEELGHSNGYFINIHGRVINPLDPYFGLENLSHSSWAKFQATVRIDGLDKHLVVNREGLLQSNEIEVFRIFLKLIFNKARAAHDTAKKAAWPKAGDVLVDAWGAVPLEPLQRAVSEGFSSVSGTPEFIDMSNVTDPETTQAKWNEVAATQPGDFIEDIVLEEKSPEESFVKYDLGKRRVVVNRNHPFSREYSETHEQQILLRDIALIDLLTEAYMVDIGIHENLISQIRDHRDQLFRLVAQVRRRTGIQIAEMLMNATNHAKGLERIVGDALEYLGFIVQSMGQAGEPEGIATAPASRAEDDTLVSYSFTYDAKSSGKGKSKTKNLNVAGLARHRENHNADHTLVVAPDYEMGALQQECQNNAITPMRANDLAALLMLVAAKGPLDLKEFRSVFNLTDPDQVHEWVIRLSDQMRATRGLSLGVFLNALVDIGFSGPDSITASVIADRIRRLPNVTYSPTRKDVTNLIHGLYVLVPNLIRISGENIILSTTPQKLREAIIAQINDIPHQYLFGLKQEVSEI